jgi:hypothetical protein
MDFDLDVFTQWITDLAPEYVWLGFNSKPECVVLPEPSVDKVQEFMKILSKARIEIRGKKLRGLKVPRASRKRSARMHA